METKENEMLRRMDGMSREGAAGALEAALLAWERPSAFFEGLRRADRLDPWFPEVKALIGVAQNPAFHPEGDVWVHTLQVLDEAAALRGEARNPLGLMLSALCHDFGKAVATEEVNGALHAYAHEKEGLPLIQAFMDRLFADAALTRYVLNMTEQHMKPNRKVSDRARKKSFMKLFDDSVCPEDLLLLVQADYMGRQADPADRPGMAEAYAPTGERLREMLAQYRALMARPGVTAGDLAAAGVAPGPLMDEALAYAHKLRLAGLSRENQLRNALGYIRSARVRAGVTGDV